jgi:hypothetical protein
MSRKPEKLMSFTLVILTLVKLKLGAKIARYPIFTKMPDGDDRGSLVQEV